MLKKILVVTANGGHLTEMQYLLSKLDFPKERVKWATYRGVDSERLDGFFSPDTHNRYLKLAFASLVAIRVLVFSRPSKVLATSDMIALPYAVLCRILNIPYIYFDCGTRIDDISLNAKLILKIQPSILVQHESLVRGQPDKRVYVGGLL